ncbi:alpha-mannosidase [Lapidilactobacillus luobeiensis]|uniref:alpha-mannosidase n=1 Tax=Lapidilactobacillus luobeiensis TaxID=2950371 RepID=UPI0021C2603E|nr:alpha-mannosidase [Lapidilactobacillus luobeiensis]
MYSEKKIKQQLGYLREQVYGSSFEAVSGLQLWQDQREDHRQVPVDAAWQSVAIGAQWSGRDAYYWLRFQVVVPELVKQQKYVIHLDLGRTGGGGNSGFEGLVFIGAKPLQAVDSNHRDIYLDARFADQKLVFSILMWSGLEGGGPQQIQHYQLKQIAAGVLDEQIRDCYRYLKLIDETVLELSADEPLKYDYQRLLDDALRQFDWGGMTAAELSVTAGQILAQIATFIDQHQGQKKAYSIAAIGHTHIDVAWLWRLKHTREKTARSFATVLALMKEYPDYKFFHSTPQVYAYIKHDYPELYAQIKQRVAEGRWEPDGGTWLEPDANIPSGEALTRQFLYGSQFFNKEFGVKQTVLWLPDVFGYSWALPQIMLGFGIDNFMTTKISWNDTNRMPHDTFIWEGLDGSRVLTHFITTTDNDADFHDSSNWRYTYNGEITPHTVLGTYHVYADKLVNNDLLLAYGYGDGGGGPTREMIENIEMIDQLPGLPSIKNTRVDDYFKQLRTNIKASGQSLATWNGELYLEYHRGTYTSQARVKQQNRQLEFALRNLEIAATTAFLRQQITYPQAEIRELWQMVLRNQFHDILPGSAIHEVYQDNNLEYQGGFAKIAQLQEKIGAVQFDPRGEHYHVTNENAWSITTTIPLTETRSGYFETSDQEKIVSQRTETGYVLQVTVPAFATLNFKFIAEDPAVKTKAAERAVDLTAVKVARQLENDFYCVTWNEAGQLVSLWDKHAHREVIGAAGVGNRLQIYEDRPTEYENWNIDGDYPEKSWTLTADQITVTNVGPLIQTVVFKYRFHQSTIKQTLILHSHSPRIDFVNDIDWQDHRYLLRTDFTVAVRASEATYDIQYGNARRPTTTNTSWEQAKFETVGHKWADLSQRDYGVALLNDGKYGYHITENNLSLSLLKSGVSPDTEADQGQHHFTYSLLPHEGDFVSGQVEPTAMVLNNGLKVARGNVVAQAALFDFQAQDAVEVDAIKLSENGQALILRLHEYTGQNRVVDISPQFAHGIVQETRLDETPLAELTAVAPQHYRVELAPYQIKTISWALQQ